MAYDAIHELVMEYGEYLENENYSEDCTKAVFTEDAEVAFAVGGPGKGIPAIAAGHTGMLTAFTGATHNITNVVIRKSSEDVAQVSFHLEVIHQFKPEIAANTPGDLFIVNDRVKAQAVNTADGWRFSQLEMNTVYKRMSRSVE